MNRAAMAVLFMLPATAWADDKMDDAIRNGLSLSVSVCFNIYTQNPMGTEQDRRLERCLGRVLAGYQIARDMMANRLTSQIGQ